MKIGFYLQNENIKNVDCSHPQDGNPGIGGTEYLFAAIPYCLDHKFRNDSNAEFEIVLIANSLDNIPEEIKSIQANDNDLCDKVLSAGIDLLVIRYSLDNYHMIKPLAGRVRIAVWAHNFIKRTELSLLAKDKDITAIICVGTEQLHFYRDHRAYNKSVVIYNAYPVKHFEKTYKNSVIPFSRRGKEVTYLGNLVDFKGFHLLAEAWKDVVKTVPEAHLNVIGGGRLYDRTQKLGTWGLAESTYEQKFMKFLVDEKGELMPSVTFHGVMGNEKSEILNKTRVGIPNPSGISETFCIAALELQLWGSVIATIDYGGFKDTVYSSGVLYDDPKKLSKSIIEQLELTDNDYNGFLQFAEKFDFERVAEDWLVLFSAIKSGESLDIVLKPAIPHEHRYKEWNRKLKSIFPFGHFFPTVMFYNSVLNRFKNKKND